MKITSKLPVINGAILLSLIILSVRSVAAGEAVPAGARDVSLITPSTSYTPSCLPDAPHGGLIRAMTARAKTLPTDDELRAELEAAAVLIDSYTSEREDLCRSLDAGAVVLAAVRQQRDGWKQVYEAERETSELLRTKWQQALKGTTGARQRLFACGPGGGAAYEPDATIRAVPGIFCIIPIMGK